MPALLPCISYLPVLVTGEWSFTALFSTHEPFVVFLLPCQPRRAVTEWFEGAPGIQLGQSTTMGGIHDKKKSRVDLFEKFSEESGAIFHFPSCRNTQKTKLLQLWTYLTVLPLKGKGSLSSMFQKNKLKIPQTRDILSQLSLPGSVFFYGQLINCSKQVLQSNENTVRTLAGAMAKGLSTWSLQWAQPNCSSPSSLQTGQHCLCRWCRAAAVKSGWHIKLMTKQWWQTSRQWSWDRKHDCQNTDREEQKKPAQTLPQNPPRTAWKDSENLSQNADWEFSQAASQSVSTRAARAQLSSDSCSSSHLSLELLGDLSQS